jgi:hypothetical protein
MPRRPCWAALATLTALALAPAAGAAPFAPGAPGLGDPYFPDDSNGGYDVARYVLDLDYDPATDLLGGVATIRARATQDLASFNLDLDGLTVRSVTVDGRPATWSHEGEELTVVPRSGLRRGSRFAAVVAYDGTPATLPDGSGVFHTDDGLEIAGEPKGADTWFPANDHPLDKAAFTFRVTVPKGLGVVANGALTGRRTRGGATTWVWHAAEPMAPYLATVNVGNWRLHAYGRAGLRFWDAIDADLFTRSAPRTGTRFAFSQAGEPSFKRLARTIRVPAGGGRLSFWIDRATEPAWDFAFVEAHTPGADDWTTLPDLNGHTSRSTGSSCPGWLELHPFLAHYQSDAGDDTCTPSGSSGEWWAASGSSHGYEPWAVDLGAWAGREVEVSISYASDESRQLAGVFVDDVEGPAGDGSTSFEDDGDPMDGWTAPGAPAGSAANPNDWQTAGADAAPAPVGEVAEATFARQPEFIAFLSGLFGRYPWSTAGGIVDANDELGFALETQTRPVYDEGTFGTEDGGASTVVHELAHQWVGDSVALAGWQHIWLNEGFSTYTEWLWSEHEGDGTAQELFDELAELPADDPFWALAIGDPGPDHLFDGQVYDRGAMTLHALRREIGDRAFFGLLRAWVRAHRGGNVTTEDFIALAERRSRRDLGAFFDAWLFTPAKPAGLAPAEAGVAARAARTARTARRGAARTARPPRRSAG